MKTCKICKNKFESKISFQTLCSRDCILENQRRLAKAQQERKKSQVVKRACRQCGKDVISTAYCPQSFCGGKYGECFRKFTSERRMDKANPAYRNGLRTNNKRGVYTSKHMRACAKYRKAFLAKNGYEFCELCKVNSNGTSKFEVHHIYYASLYPKHKELHNFLNLIMLCMKCHNDMHSGKMRSEVFHRLEEERGLKQLFQ